jgi:hypothetical protein
MCATRLGYAQISRVLPAARLAVVEIGASAGLNLFSDQYRYEYERAERALMMAGDSAFPVRSGSALRGSSTVGSPPRRIHHQRNTILAGAVAMRVGIGFSAVSGCVSILDQAAKSISVSTSVWLSVCHPSTLHMVIWPAASNAQNSMAAVSAEVRTVCVLMRRLNSSWSRSIALVVRALFHRLSGNRVKVKSRSPAFSRLSATALHSSRHLRMKARRRCSISAAEAG